MPGDLADRAGHRRSRHTALQGQVSSSVLEGDHIVNVRVLAIQKASIPPQSCANCRFARLAAWLRGWIRWLM